MIDGEPFDGGEAQQLVRSILESGNLGFSGHALEEMAKDQLQTPDVVNVLRAGWVEFPEEKNGSWRYRFTTNRIVVVVAFRSREHAVVVTAWRLS